MVGIEITSIFSEYFVFLNFLPLTNIVIKKVLLSLVNKLYAKWSAPAPPFDGGNFLIPNAAILNILEDHIYQDTQLKIFSMASLNLNS